MGFQEKGVFKLNLKKNYRPFSLLKSQNNNKNVLAVFHFYTCPLEISNYNFQFHSMFKEH